MLRETKNSLQSNYVVPAKVKIGNSCHLRTGSRIENAQFVRMWDLVATEPKRAAKKKKRNNATALLKVKMHDIRMDTQKMQDKTS